MEKISVKELFKIWSHVAAHSFGGPAGQIAVIHKLVVEDKKIISEKRFLHALNFCMLLPGPEAQQLATYMGWLMNKWKGGLIAGGLFILPGFLSILALSYLYVLYKDVTFISGMFYGIKPAIIAIVLAALLRISKKSLNSKFNFTIALFAFLSLFFLNLPFPLVVISSAVLGIIYGKLVKEQEEVIEQTDKPRASETFKTLFTWLFVWFLPIIGFYLIYGDSTYHTLNLFFSKMSLVTFGGAYAALSYVAQQAVEFYGWMSGAEMLDGLALAETTPGPLIQVVQFVGFMGAYRFPGTHDPLMSAFIGSVLTTWMTFAPCFLFIFTFAPYIEYIRGKLVFKNALSAITAAVVGVIFNLSLWFVLKALFLVSNKVNFGIFNFEYPVIQTLDINASIICIIAMIMQFKFKQSLFRILGMAITLGVIKYYVFHHIT